MTRVKFGYDEFDLSGVRTYPLASRSSKARHEDFARAWDPATGVSGFLASLPNMLAARDLREVVAAIARARAAEGGIVWGIGAHVIKTGLGPVIIDLMERGFVSALAMNGAGIMISDSCATIKSPPPGCAARTGSAASAARTDAR